jgi:hypothetical protein
LLFAIISISTATQQSNNLQKIMSHPQKGLIKIRAMLESKHVTALGKKTASFNQHFVWQTPIMLLNFSILLFVAGLMILVIKLAVDKAGGMSMNESQVNRDAPVSEDIANATIDCTRFEHRVRILRRKLPLLTSFDILS